MCAQIAHVLANRVADQLQREPRRSLTILATDYHSIRRFSGDKTVRTMNNGCREHVPRAQCSLASFSSQLSLSTDHVERTLLLAATAVELGKCIA